MSGSAAAQLFAVGFLSMLGQVVLLRELAAASFGVDLLYLVGMALWLAAGAAGAAAGGSGDRPPDTRAAFFWLGVFLPLQIVFLRGARILFGGVPGAYLPLGRQAAVAALGVAPAGVALGLLFRRAGRRLVDGGGSIAGAYAWESAGGALGSVAATASLHFGVPNLALGIGCAVLGAGASACAGPGRRAAIAQLAVLLALLAGSFPLDRWTASWNHPGVVATVDTPYGRIAATRAGDQFVVFENDALAFESEGTEAEEFVHVSALHAPAVENVLALEGAVSGIAREIRKHAPARVDCVEPDRAMYRAVVPRLPPDARRAVETAPVRLVFADPRRFLRTAPVYDLILVAAPEPASGQSNRFYTVEFFRQCAARLSPAGVLALRLPSAEEFWTPHLVRRNASVHAALRAAFPDVRVIPGSVDIFLASRGRIPRDPGEIAGRFRARKIAARRVTPDYLRYLLTNDRVVEAERRLAREDAPPNSDARPVCYGQTLLLWLDRFLPAEKAAALPGRRAVQAGLAVAAAAILLVGRLRVSWRRAVLAGVAGFCGMAAEAVVLLRYQAESGALYQDIGILLTSFMIGLAAGASLFRRAAAGRREIGRAWGAVLLAGFGLLNAGLAAASVSGGILFRLGASSAFLCATGALSAAIFGYASRRGVDDPGRAVALLYAADLLGGCLAAMAAGVVLIPAFGAFPTAAGAALLAVGSLLLL